MLENVDWELKIMPLQIRLDCQTSRCQKKSARNIHMRFKEIQGKPGKPERTGSDRFRNRKPEKPETGKPEKPDPVKTVSSLNWIQLKPEKLDPVKLDPV